MPVGTQFTASLDPGQYQVWATWGWGREFRVEWSVRPSSGQVGNVVLRALTVEAVADGSLTYHLTVWNIGSAAVTFDALYQYDGVSAFGAQGLEGIPNPAGLWGTTVMPQTLADNGDGVLGEGLNGVHGRSRSPTDSGVWGENTNAGFGVSGSTGGVSGSRGVVAGVWGSNSATGAGVRGSCSRGTGVLGEGSTGILGQGPIGVKGVSGQKGTWVPSPGVFGQHTDGDVGVWGFAAGAGSVGVLGSGDYGAVFGGKQAPMQLIPAQTAGFPTSGKHNAGELYVDSNGVLFYCQSAGTPGTWKRVQLA